MEPLACFLPVEPQRHRTKITYGRVVHLETFTKQRQGHVSRVQCLRSAGAGHRMLVTTPHARGRRGGDARGRLELGSGVGTDCVN